MSLLTVPASKPRKINAHDVSEETSPLEDRLISWSASLNKTMRPDFAEWLANGSPTPGHSQQKPTYYFKPRYELIEEYGSRATVINAALEITFGSRGSNGWTIWASGDRINSLMQEIRLAFLTAKAELADTQIRLLDLWIKDLFGQFESIYNRTSHIKASNDVLYTDRLMSRSGRIHKSPLRPIWSTSLSTSPARKLSPDEDAADIQKRVIPNAEPGQTNSRAGSAAAAHRSSTSESPDSPSPTKSVKRGKRKQLDDSDDEPQAISMTAYEKARTTKPVKKAKVEKAKTDATKAGRDIPGATSTRNKQYTCNHCKVTVRSEGTTNLKKHQSSCAKLGHARSIKAPGIVVDTLDVAQAVLNPTTMAVQLPFSKDRHFDLVTEWVCIDGRPWSVVAVPSLQRVLTHANNQATMPDPTTVARRASKMSDVCLEELDSKLQRIASTIHYIHDGWTASDRTAGYLGLYVSWMDEDFNFRQSFDRLMFPHVKGAHTGKRIGDGLYDHFRALKIEKNLGPGTADNASNNLSAAEQIALRLYNEHDIKTEPRHLVGCLAHTVNLAAHDFIRAECQLQASDYEADQYIGEIPDIKIIGENGLISFAPDEYDFDTPAADEDDLAEADESAEGNCDEGESRWSRGKNDASPLGLVHNFCKWVHRSSRRKDNFHSRRDNEQADAHRLLPLLDVVTRWDSKEAAIGRLFLLEKRHFQGSADHSPDPPYFPPTHQEVLEKVDALAHDFLLEIHLAIAELKRTASSIDQDERRRRSVEGAIEKLEKYMDRGLENDWLCTAFALNPGNKERGLAALFNLYGKSLRLAQVQLFIRNRITRWIIEPRPSQTEISSCIADKPPITSLSQNANPFAIYTEAPPDPASDIAFWSAYNSTDPVFAAVQGKTLPDFWRRVKRTGRYDPLCLFVRDILGLSVASTSVERLFSHVNNVLGRRRGSLSPCGLIHQTTVRMLRRQGKDGRVLDSEAPLAGS